MSIALTVATFLIFHILIFAPFMKTKGGGRRAIKAFLLFHLSFCSPFTHSLTSCLTFLSLAFIFFSPSRFILLVLLCILNFFLSTLHSTLPYCPILPFRKLISFVPCSFFQLLIFLIHTLFLSFLSFLFPSLSCSLTSTFIHSVPHSFFFSHLVFPKVMCRRQD